MKIKIILTIFISLCCGSSIFAAYTLTTTANATYGNIYLSPPGPSYNASTVVTVLAQPNLDYGFTSWGGDLTGSGSTNPATITMLGDRNVTAYFKSFPHTVMLAPADQSTVTTQPTFTWQTNNSGVSKYKVQICTDAGMTAVFTENASIASSATSITLQPGVANWTNNKIALDASKTYYWRIVAYDNSSPAVTSASVKFQFTTSALAPTVLTSPANNATNVAIQPNFTWQSNLGASRYKVQVCTDIYFTTMVVDIDKNDNGSNITGTSYQMSSKTLPSSVLDIGKTYYWRVVAYDGSNNTTVNNPNKFTVVLPTIPYYPIPETPIITCAFGPRNYSTTWHHGGIDIQRTGIGATQAVVAPFNCEVRRIFQSYGVSCIDFVNTETACLYPTSTRLQHISVPASVTVGTTFKRGQLITNTLELYENNYHVHESCWNIEITPYFVASEQGVGNAPSANPLQYWAHTTGNYSYSNVGPSSSWPTDPEVGNLRYFYFTYTCPRSDFLLERIVVQVMGSNNQNITADFLANPDAATINFNSGAGIPRSSNGVTATFNGVTGYANDNAATTGVKLLAQDLTPTGNKVYHFRYYIKSTAPNPTIFQAQFYDCNGATGTTSSARLPIISSDLPQTPVGGSTQGAPTGWVLTSLPNGVKITWSNWPSNTYPVDYWAVYRKIQGSSLGPDLIGITKGSSFEDRTDICTNTIVPGTAYSYTVSGRNKIGQGPLGAWQNFTITSLPTDIIFQNRVVSTIEPELKAKNSITLQSVNILGGACKLFRAGSIINMGTNITVNDRAIINYSIDPTLK